MMMAMLVWMALPIFLLLKEIQETRKKTENMKKPLRVRISKRRARRVKRARRARIVRRARIALPEGMIDLKNRIKVA